MIVMTTKSDAPLKDILEGNVRNMPDSAIGEASRTHDTDRVLNVHSGLSALIQAATFQLSHLDDDTQSSSLSHLHEKSSSHSTVLSSLLDTTSRAPPISREADPRLQSFPQILMTLAVDPKNIDVITFLPDGKFFAIRTHEFCKDAMINCFSVATFEEFLDLLNDWGFSRLLQENNFSGIELFRHPLFIECDWKKCDCIKFGESPTDVRVSALPERARIEYTLSDDAVCSPSLNASNTKRRLSPGFLARRETEPSVSCKQRVKSKEPDSSGSDQSNIRSRTDSDCNESLPTASHSTQSQVEELRSVALAITSEKLNIKNDSRDTPTSRNSTPLADEAVESCTHTIVTDAIETLLRDETHTKETYLKHENELGRSSLPGIISISKQLFSPKDFVENERTPPAEIIAKRPSVSLSVPILDEVKSHGEALLSEQSSNSSPVSKQSVELEEPVATVL